MNGSVLMGKGKIQRRLRYGLFLLLFMMLSTALYQPVSASSEERRPQNVLVLHSYQKGFA